MAKQPEKPPDETPMQRLERLTKALLKVPKDAIREDRTRKSGEDKPQPQS